MDTKLINNGCFRFIHVTVTRVPLALYLYTLEQGPVVFPLLCLLSPKFVRVLHGAGLHIDRASVDRGLLC